MRASTKNASIRRRAVVVVAIALVAVTLGGCQVAKAGTRCRGNKLGRDATHVLACRNGRWVKTVTLSWVGQSLRDRATADGPRLSGARQIAAADYATCALMADSTVKCWGAWLTGRAAYLGSRSPVTVVGLSNVTQIDLGARFGCALVAGGTVTCWGGDNRLGQLGDGTKEERYDPVVVPGVSNAVQISAGGDHACARINDGTIRCWGANGSGELGNGATVTDFSPTPAVQVVGITDAVDVTAGYQHTCAAVSDGSVECWGENQFGELGTFDDVDSAVPVPVWGAWDVTDVESNGYRTCSVAGDGFVWCWGAEYSGENEVPDLPAVANISLGFAGFSCAAMVNGTVRCWGSDDFTDLGGAGTTALNDVVGVASGWGHTCALRRTTNVVCWGYDSNGQLGDGLQLSTPPIGTVVTVAAGS